MTTTALDLYRTSASEKDIQAGIVRRLRLLGALLAILMATDVRRTR